MTLKFTWNVHEINLHLAFNWDLNVLEVCVTQSWWFYHWIIGTPRPVQYWRQFLVLNVTSNNISVISWWSVLLVKETRVPGENQRHVASHWHGFFDCCTPPWMGFELTTLVMIDTYCTGTNVVVNPTTIRSRPQYPLPISPTFSSTYKLYTYTWCKSTLCTRDSFQIIYDRDYRVHCDWWQLQ